MYVCMYVCLYPPPHSPFLRSRVRALSISVALTLSVVRACTRLCADAWKTCAGEREKGLRRKGERTSCRVAARGAARALRSACGAGTHTDSQRGLRYKTCAQLPEPSSEPMDTHIKLYVSRYTCMLCDMCICIMFHYSLNYIYTYRYQIYT